MAWETTLFYWTGWFAITTVLLAAGLIGSYAFLWTIYNKKESAFYANAALLRAYLEYAYRYRFKHRGVTPSKIDSFKVDGYEITVKKLEEEG